VYWYQYWHWVLVSAGPSNIGYWVAWCLRSSVKVVGHNEMPFCMPSNNIVLYIGLPYRKGRSGVLEPISQNWRQRLHIGMGFAALFSFFFIFVAVAA